MAAAAAAAEGDGAGGAGGSASTKQLHRPSPKGSSGVGIKLGALSGSTHPPKFSFGTASRFNYGNEKGEKNGRSRSSPALSGAGNASVSTAAPEDDLDDSFMEFPSAGGVGALGCGAVGAGGAARHNASAYSAFSNSTWMPDRGRMDHTATLCRSSKAPRLEAALDRGGDPPQRAAMPKAKQYEPIMTMGASTSISLQHSPQFSFGGGKSRAQPLEEPRRSARTASPTSVQPRRRKQMCRGFGSAVRLQHRGSAFELPISPGPAAYEIPREGDAVPLWAAESLKPWGRRTGGRSALVAPSASDVGPGEYTANQPFQAAAPSAKFGHTLRELTRDVFPGPGNYPLPSTLVAIGGAQSGGERSSWTTGDGPGPGTYDPHLGGVDPQLHGAVFGTLERRHEADEVDPDEPPGPGTHEVRRDMASLLLPGGAMPKGDGRKEVSGMGPKNVPGPGQYAVDKPQRGTSVAIGTRLAEPSVKCPVPGPGRYEPEDHLVREAAVGHRPMHYTAPRRSPFGDEGSHSEKTSEAMLKRCAVQAAEEAIANGLPPPKKETPPPEYVATGPSYSFGARRPGRAMRPWEDQPLPPPVSTVG